MSELRIYAIVNSEALAQAGGNRGKMMAQAGHAFLHAYWDAEKRAMRPSADEDGYGDYESRPAAYAGSNAAVKIVLVGENAAQLQSWYDEMKGNMKGIGVTLVTDAARTVFTEPTVTFLGIGPITKEEAPEWLKSLKVLI